MRYNQSNFPKGHILVDANGKQIDNAIWCDTETGEVRRLIHCSEPGNKWRTPGLEFGCWLDREPFLAPLRVVPTDDK